MESRAIWRSNWKVLSNSVTIENMVKNALMGGVKLAMIEGASIALARVVLHYVERTQLNAAMTIIKLTPPPVDPQGNTGNPLLP